MKELQNNTDFKFRIGINLTDYCFLFLMKIPLLIHQNQQKYLSIYESSPLWVVFLMSTKYISLIPGKIQLCQCSSRHTYLLWNYIGNNCLIVRKNIFHKQQLLVSTIYTAKGSKDNTVVFCAKSTIINNTTGAKNDIGLTSVINVPQLQEA